jgi:Bacterial Ig domain
MRALFLKGILVVFLLATAMPRLLLGCGVERWSVKTGSDADAGSVNLGSQSSNTIATMRGWPVPSPIPPNNRVSPYETTVWVLNATLTQFKSETDQDYHLVLTDSNGLTMIAEIPDPGCVAVGSPFTSGISSSRSTFDAHYTATSSFQTVNVPVQIVGVGMFDFLHGQTGVAPNGIELHPVLSITFNPSGAGFSMAASPASVSAVQGSSATTTIATSVTGGFSSTVLLSASGVPSGASTSFSPSSISGAGSSTLTLSAGTAAAGTYPVTVTGTSGGTSHSTTVSFTVTPSGSGGFPESAHPYANNFDQTWTYTLTGTPASVNVTFDPQTSVEATYDFIYVMDKNGVNITGSPFTGTTLAGATKNVVGDTVKIRLTSDSSVTQYGFKVTNVVAGSGSGDTTPPTTSVTAPANGATVSGTTNITATASDAVGVVKIEVYVDGALKGSNTGATSFTYAWSTTTATNGAHTITSKAYDAANNVGTSATVNVTVSNTTTSQQLLGNPGFETGTAAPWVTTSGVVDNGTSEAAHTGSWKAWMNGYGAVHTDTVMQQVAIPASATSATLTFWLHIDTAETGTTAYDTLKVQVRNSSGTVLSTLATYSNVNAAAGYTQKSFNLISYKGQTIQVNLVGIEDASLQTSFVVDDFALNVQ